MSMLSTEFDVLQPTEVWKMVRMSRSTGRSKLARQVASCRFGFVCGSRGAVEQERPREHEGSVPQLLFCIQLVGSKR